MLAECRILFLSTYSQKYPSAARSRILNIASGFISRNHVCDIFFIPDLVYVGRSLSQKLRRTSLGWLLWLWEERELFRTKGNFIVYVYSENFSFCVLAYLLGKRFGGAVVFDVCEWPHLTDFVDAKGFIIGFQDFFRNRLYIYFVSLFADGIVSISSLIHYRVESMGRKSIKVPALITHNVFSGRGCEATYSKNSSDDNLDKLSLFYSGSLKPFERLDKVLEAMVQLSHSLGRQLELNVFGNFSKKDFFDFIGAESYERDLKFCKVYVWGLVSDDVYRREMTRSNALILPRGTSPSALASFPNRLPEYLISGVPVITPPIYDTVLYLKPYCHFIPASFDSATSIYDAVRFCLTPSRHLVEITHAARRRAQRVFDSHYQMARVSRFIRSEVLTKESAIRPRM
jgi:glycosyltransferase involved in cell wall biosynthesis